MNRKVVLLIIAILAMISVVVYLVFKVTSPDTSMQDDADEEIYIGTFFALTGATSEQAVPVANGIRDCVLHINNDLGGVDGRKIGLLEADTSYRVSKAIMAYKQMTKKHPVLAILSWGTGETEALSPLVNRDQIPCLASSFAETIADPVRNPYNFIFGASYTDQYTAALRYIRRKFRLENRKPRIAFIYSNTAFGRSPFFPHGDQIAGDYGVGIVDKIIVNLDQTDTTLQMRALKASEADFAIVQESLTATAAILSDAKKIGVDCEFIGLHYAIDEKLPEMVGDAANGYIFVQGYPMRLNLSYPDVRQVVDIAEKLGRDRSEISQRYLQGFSEMYFLYQVIKNTPKPLTGAALRDTMETLEEYKVPGLGLTIDYTAKRHKPSVPVSFYRIENGKIQKFSEAGAGQ